MLSRRIQKSSPSSAETGSGSGSAAVPPRCKEFSERRRVVEQARSLNVRRIQQEVQRIAQREIEFAQRLLSEYTPVKLSVNESAWARWQEFLPVRLDFVKADEAAAPAAPAAPASSNEGSHTSTEESSWEAPIA